MKSITTVARLAFVWGIMTACSGPQQFYQAPKNQEEAESGLLVTATSKNQSDSLIAISDSYRVISAQHNIYELRGITKAEVLAIDPKASIERNRYFQALSTATNKKSSQLTNLLQRADDSPAAQPLPISLQDCTPGAVEKPIPQVSILSNNILTGNTMNMEDTLELSGSTSIPHIEGDNLEIRWELFPPANSSLKQEMKTSKTFKLTPDTVGEFHVLFVAKGSDNSCGYQALTVLVTHNPKIEFVREGENQPSSETSAFKHLEKINAEKAWQNSTGEGITIAILDTGLQYNHPGIKFNLAFNQQEKTGSPNQDSDGNGYVDDVLGWDFINDDNSAFDDEGHGSHVAGLSSSHIHGSAPSSKVLPVKVLSASGGGDLGTFAKGIFYAVEMNVDIINTSIQGRHAPSPMILDAIEAARAKNIIFISASGNSGLDLSIPGNDVYPGEVDSENVINVGATDSNDNITDYSNFGKNEVDIAAPGGTQEKPLYSLSTHNTHNRDFVPSFGTSMAAPVAAGIAALVLSANPSLTPTEVRSILMTSGQEISALSNKVGSGQLLDANQAVQKAQTSTTLN